jgi:chemotaxis protein methyltransferase CheR
MSINDLTFRRFSDWMKQQTGVFLSEAKKPLVQQRLHKRLQARRLPSLEAYFKLLNAPEEDAERQIAIDLLTTHETYFFREEKHFDWLKSQLQHWPRRQTFNVWCAAASSGEEVWTLAMVLADGLGVDGDWHVLGSDISLPMLEKAERGHYPLERCERIPPDTLRRYCLKGTGRQQGTMLIGKPLRSHVGFRPINLDQALPAMGPFSLIFMRNVLIYFNGETKQQVVSRALLRLQDEGHFVVSHSESLHGLVLPLRAVAPGVYRKSP